MFNFFNKIRYFDSTLFVATGLLSLAGFSLLYSNAISSGLIQTLVRQGGFFLIGFAGLVFFSFFDYHRLAKANTWIYIVILISLVYLLLFGTEIRGGRRWISLGIVQIQMAEFAKISVILTVSRLLHLARGKINSPKYIIWSFALAAVPAALILNEPDLGSALVIFGIWGGTLLLSNIKKSYIFILICLAIISAGISWKFFLKDFQKDRIQIFLNPNLDPKGRGYNVRQASIAIGSGGVWGRGFGRGQQSQNNFLPEHKTDFIFAASAEEIGFAGVISLISLYFIILYRLVVICQKAKDDLGMYIAGGIFFLLFIHTMVNIGMNIGILPVTGIPLPFLSAGGSSLIATFISLGIAENIFLQSKMLRF